MKLGALSCVAALALVGCVDSESVGGGQGDGILPSKTADKTPDVVPSNDGPNVVQQPALPADIVCDGCVVTIYKPVQSTVFDEIRVVTDHDFVVCSIYVNHGEVVVDECGFEVR